MAGRSASDFISPADCQRIGLLDASEILGSRADVTVAEQKSDSFQVTRLAQDMRGANAFAGLVRLFYFPGRARAALRIRLTLWVRIKRGRVATLGAGA